MRTEARRPKRLEGHRVICPLREARGYLIKTHTSRKWNRLSEVTIAPPLALLGMRSVAYNLLRWGCECTRCCWDFEREWKLQPALIFRLHPAGQCSNPVHAKVRTKSGPTLRASTMQSVGGSSQSLFLSAFTGLIRNPPLTPSIRATPRFWLITRYEPLLSSKRMLPRYGTSTPDRQHPQISPHISGSGGEHRHENFIRSIYVFKSRLIL